MNDHYYSETPASKSQPYELRVETLGQSLGFMADAGVFSRGGLDAGSRILLESLPPINGRVLDLGCGWGAIGLTLAKKYPEARFVLADLNERAVELTAKNIRLNGLTNAEAIKSDGFSAVTGAFDAIVTNPPIRAGKKQLYNWFETARSFLKPGALMYLVIRKQQGAQSAMQFLSGVYGRVERINRDGGYWIIACEKEK